MTLFLAILSLLGVATSSIAQDSQWKLVWSDEFGGESLAYAKWEAEANAFRGGNQELQIYTDRKENVGVEAGHPVLEVRRDNHEIAGTVREYSSGRIRSKQRLDRKYGKFEIRAQRPAGQSVRPAFWMLPTDEVYGTWTASGEIDILDFKGQEPNVV